MDNIKTLQEAIKLQNDFILEMFNDDEIQESVKTKYAKKYNELYIKTQIVLKV